jgi:hypothetical protein
MNHLVPAAEALVHAVQVIRPDATWQMVGVPDGYQRRRSIQFDTDTSSWLRPILHAILDPRVAEVSHDEQMTVTFVGDVRADRRDPYPLGIVAKVLYDD